MTKRQSRAKSAPLILAMLGGLIIAPAARADPNSDEANRQNMMAEMRNSAAANDRANFDSQQRQQANADRYRSSGNGGSGSSGGSSGGNASPSANYGARTSTGPQSIVASYNFTVHRQETPAALMTRLEQEADGGNALSAFNLGRIYYTGFDGIPRDDATARHWFFIAANAGHPGGEAQFGQMMYNGIGGPTDQTTALTWLKSAAGHGDSYGQALYGFWTLSDQVKADPDVRNPELVAILVKAADAGQLVAQAYLGTIVYRLGAGAPADQERAAHYLRLAADQNFAGAQTLLGRSYIYGTGVPRDYAQAVVWLRKGAAQNDAEANYLLGRLAIDGAGGLPQDAAAGAELVKRAADAGNMEATGFYGVLLQQGIGIPKDQSAGAILLQRAAESHDSDAEENYAIAFFDGMGVTQNIATGVYWQKRAADDGNYSAAATYCVRATTGNGMSKNATEGVKYGRIGASGGAARAQTCLGYAYLEGNGVPKDLPLAKSWFEKAAAQDYADAIDALKLPELSGI